ncbi:glycosyltransferase family 2 protein [Amnibacterium endophyticum]|uniref:Glycosyltransferase family 2 protein n=1 Tax=Amnibacterium endophyticum TaxID=2109337 RepID=A0ABW4L9N8_9MICO
MTGIGQLRTEDVTAVIPTTGRASLPRAVRSVLDQTSPVGEVIVCNDGTRPLPMFADARVRVVEVGPRAGGNTARMAGVRAARTPLVALLDDDDRWLPGFGAALLEHVAPLGAEEAWVAGCRILREDGSVYPKRLKTPDEDLLGYAFRLRRSGGKGALPTSTLLFPRRLALEVPWRTDLRFHQDLTWLIDLYRAHPHLRVAQAPAALVEMDDSPGSITKSIDVGASMRWAEAELLESFGRRREYGDFLLSRYPLRTAVDARRWGQALGVVSRGVVRGRPGLPAVAYALAYAVRSGLRGAETGRGNARTT